jgi:dienelactone hydrolase
VAFTAALGAPAAEPPMQVRFPWQPGLTRQFDANAAEGELVAWLFRAGDAPTPFVIFLHGCGGLHLANVAHWAEFFRKHGVGVLMVDSLAPRATASACESKEPWLRRRADDAAAGLAWLTSQPFAKADRIALMGQSQGAGAALFALQEGRPTAGRLVAGFLLYPPCAAAVNAGVRLAKPVYVGIGDADNWTPASACEALRALQPDGRMDLDIHAGAVHSFDNPVKPRVVLGRYNVGEHPAARDRVRERALQFVERHLR